MNALLDTPIWQLTPRQLFALQDEHMKRSTPQAQPIKEPKKWVTLDEAAKIINRAKASLYRYMQDWDKIGAVSKIGGVTLVNIEIITKASTNKNKRQF